MAGPILMERPHYHSATALVDQAEGLERDQVMKRVVGPALTSFLRPIYEVSTPIAASNFWEDPPTLDNAVIFVDVLENVLKDRLRQRITDNPAQYEEFERLNDTRPDIFHYKTSGMLHEGIDTSLAAPFIVATHIGRVERGDVNGRLHCGSPFNREETVKILQRDSVDKILHRLTKGPNGFLGAPSSRSQAAYSPDFFEFYMPPYRNEPLHIKRAYRTQDGRVTDLSGDYYLSANEKRDKIQRDFNDPRYRQSGDHHFAVSSGCPVRHRFKDETGEPQESLITLGRKFLASGLEGQ
jgi:hypothetical protein